MYILVWHYISWETVGEGGEGGRGGGGCGGCFRRGVAASVAHAQALRAYRRDASSSARSFMLWPVCARICRLKARTVIPFARSLARALTLRSCTIALFFRGAHAPTVVQMAICESEKREQRK